ncbi:hypothetical protein [Paenibacillus wynnii]|nr:hypothetical protein [Paenibacillus wynnii]
MNRSVKVIILLLVLFCLGGCDSGTQGVIFENEDRLKESGDSYSFSNKVGEITSEQGQVEFSGFSGVYTALYLNSTSDTTTQIMISGKIRRGDFKLIQITADHQLITLWEGEGNKDMSITVPAGEGSIKWVGRNAAGHITMKLVPQVGLEAQPHGDLFDEEE